MLKTRVAIFGARKYHIIHVDFFHIHVKIYKRQTTWYHVYAPEKFDQPQFVCDMEYFYSRLLNFKTPYRHYESKPAYFNVRHNLTTSELNTASELRQPAICFKKQLNPR